MDGDGSLADCVRAFWAQALPSVPFDPDMSWRDAGLDSLQALHLALRLEQVLGRKVSFDGLAPDCTPNDLIRSLSQKAAPRTARADPRPLVFFVPGLTGDNPREAAFRLALRREVRFETLDVGGVDTPGPVLAHIPARAARLVDVVLQGQPQGEVRLAGCSFGALVAQEMARQLEARGRVVAFLGLLDGLLSPPVFRPTEDWGSAERRQRADARERWKLRLMRWFGPALRHTGVLELIRKTVSADAMRSRPWARTAGIHLLRAWGYWAVKDWRPGEVAAPTLLVTTDEFPEFSSLEAWRKACPRLRVVPAPGRHVHLFDPPAMAVLAPAFLAALTELAGAPA